MSSASFCSLDSSASLVIPLLLYVKVVPLFQFQSEAAQVEHARHAEDVGPHVKFGTQAFQRDADAVSKGTKRKRSSD